MFLSNSISPSFYAAFMVFSMKLRYEIEIVSNEFTTISTSSFVSPSFSYPSIVLH